MLMASRSMSSVSLARAGTRLIETAAIAINTVRLSRFFKDHSFLVTQRDTTPPVYEEIVKE